MIVLILASLLLIAVLQYYWQHRKFYKLYNKMPLSHSHLPFIGMAYKYIYVDTKKLYDSAKFLTTFGPSPRRFFAGPVCSVVVDNVDQLQKLLNSKYAVDKSFIYKKLILKRG